VPTKAFVGTVLTVRKGWFFGGKNEVYGRVEI